jgi:hypothetical protein
MWMSLIAGELEGVDFIEGREWAYAG